MHFGATFDDVLVYENDPLQDHGELTLRQASTGKILTRFAADWPVNMGLAHWWIPRVDPTGAYFAISTPDNRINVFRSANGSLASSMNWPNEQFADIAFSRGGDVLTVVTQTGNVTFLKTEDGRILGVQRELGRFSQFPDAITLSSSTGRLIAVDAEGRVDVISLASLSFRSFFSGVSEPGLRAANRSSISLSN